MRRATGRFKDINVAFSEGFVRGTPCVSGPDHGAMGVHLVQPYPFYELHVWAWENNPSGTFADWNNQVSCDNSHGD